MKLRSAAERAALVAKKSAQKEARAELERPPKPKGIGPTKLTPAGRPMKEKHLTREEKEDIIGLLPVETRQKLSADKLALLSPCKLCDQKHVDHNNVVLCAGHYIQGGTYFPCRARPSTADGYCAACAGLVKLPKNELQEWRRGLYAEKMPKNLRYVFTRASEGDAMVSMKLQMALIDAREAQLVERLGTDESGAKWALVKKIAEDLKLAITSDNESGIARHQAALLHAIDAGCGDEAQWAEIRENAEMRRRIAEVERKNIEAEKAQMSLEQIGQVASFLGNLLKRYITDTARLAAAAEELQRYFAGTIPLSNVGQPIDVEVIDGKAD